MRLVVVTHGEVAQLDGALLGEASRCRRRVLIDAAVVRCGGRMVEHVLLVLGVGGGGVLVGAYEVRYGGDHAAEEESDEAEGDPARLGAARRRERDDYGAEQAADVVDAHVDAGLARTQEELLLQRAEYHVVGAVHQYVVQERGQAQHDYDELMRVSQGHLYLSLSDSLSLALTRVCCCQLK